MFAFFPPLFRRCLLFSIALSAPFRLECSVATSSSAVSIPNFPC